MRDIKIPRLEVHRVHRYPKIMFDMNDGMTFDEAHRNRHPRPSAAENMEDFLGNPDPMALFRMEVNAKRCLLYDRMPANPLRGAKGIIATWEGFYVRFAHIEGKYAQLRSMGLIEHPMKHRVPREIHGIPLYMRHALAGWLHMKYVELSSQHLPSPVRPTDVEGGCP